MERPQPARRRRTHPQASRLTPISQRELSDQLVPTGAKRDEAFAVGALAEGAPRPSPVFEIVISLADEMGWGLGLGG